LKYRKSERWIRKQLDEVKVSRRWIKPQEVVVIADMTFCRREFGVCVLRSPHLKKNLVWQPARRETKEIYHSCRLELEKQGFEVQAAVMDGKPGIKEAFWDIPIQMCQFHQIAIVTRYLTTHPKLEAGRELRRLALTLPHVEEYFFEKELKGWYEKWESFLKEKSYNPETRRWYYTHKRLRSAYRSLRDNKEILFTYQRYPELHIPNTTNSLDGTFSHVKSLLRIHRGLKAWRKIKLIDEILSK
jgi:hypothetical protein